MPKRYLLLLLLAFTTAVAIIPLGHTDDCAKPKNIIFYIGDGMGVSQVTAARINKGKLNLDRFKTLGLVTTHAKNELITDSAAAATAMATGHKTSNGTISLSPTGKRLKTVLEAAEESGKSTGIVVTCSVTHATPAAFLAHAKSRNLQNLIAEEITASGVDVLLGGGWAEFVPGSTTESKRRDEVNLLARLGKRLKVITTADEFKNLGDVDTLVGLFAPNHPRDVSIRKPALPALTRKAIEILAKNKNGFFLMVEGSQIDWAGHARNQDRVIAETIDFDNAVGIGLDFAQTNGKTLIIVTADHETGGFAILNGSIKKKIVTKSRFTSHGHTATMVPLFAYGPDNKAFAGIQDNTHIGKELIRLLTPVSPSTTKKKIPEPTNRLKEN